MLILRTIVLYIAIVGIGKCLCVNPCNDEKLYILLLLCYISAKRWLANAYHYGCVNSPKYLLDTAILYA